MSSTTTGSSDSRKLQIRHSGIPLRCLLFQIQDSGQITIISENDEEVYEIMSGINDMGAGFVEALRCIADILKGLRRLQ